MATKLKVILKRLEEIEARAAKATPGPWELETHVVEPRGSSQVIRCDDRIDFWNNESCANAEFIAHSREDVPWLCELARKLLAVAEAARKIWGEVRDRIKGDFWVEISPDWEGWEQLERALAALEEVNDES